MATITKALIVINVLVFLLVFSMPPEMRDATIEAFAFSQGTALQVWRWVTNLFLHASASHLFFNMLGLYFFGKILEQELHPSWFLATYFIAGFLGNFAFLLTSTEFVVGASGAMFGIMGAAMLLNPVKKVHLYVFPLPLAIVAIAFVIFETFVVLFQPSFADANVANISHVAGILTGAIFAFFHAPKKASKGIMVLIFALILLIFLAPVFALIAGVGGIIIQAVDFVIGIVLYTLAGLLGFLWV